MLLLIFFNKCASEPFLYYNDATRGNIGPVIQDHYTPFCFPSKDNYDYIWQHIGLSGLDLLLLARTFRQDIEYKNENLSLD